VPTDRGLDRLITFVDAVVAIAITLLVLPLVEVLADPGDERRLGPLLGAHIADFFTFTLSFVVIARLWLAHHALSERVGSYDRQFVVLNLLWAFTIVALPFATRVTAGFGAQRLAIGIYIGTVTVSSACSTALTLLVRRRPRLRAKGVTAADVPLEQSVAVTSLLLVALVVGLLAPAVGYLALFLLFLDTPLARLLRRRAGA
jgi:uncharacterized membrane protein